MSVDDRLLSAQTEKNSDNQTESSSDRAGALRESQRAEENNENEPEQEDLRSQVMSKRKEMILKMKGKFSQAELAFSAGTSKLLQGAWRNIVTSFGFSFLYVYVHLFLKGIFGKRFFADLGSEWRDRPGLTIEERERMGVSLKVIESFGVGAISILIFIVLIFNLSILALLVEFVSNPLRVTGALIQSFWSWIFDA